MRRDLNDQNDLKRLWYRLRQLRDLINQLVPNFLKQAWWSISASCINSLRREPNADCR